MKRFILCVLILLPLVLPYHLEVWEPETTDGRAVSGTETIYIEEVRVPILMYHHISYDGDISVTLTAELFDEHMAALKACGFTTVTFDELYAYTVGYGELPERPIVLVFDDGYRSVYENAFPVLRKYGMRATACIIGWSVGKGRADGIIPHFDWEEAREMIDSGVFVIGSHTYAMHDGAVRQGGESAGAFASRLRADYLRLASDILRETGERVSVFAYPHGYYDGSAEAIVRSLGARVTLTTDVGVNIVRRGHPEDLYLMKRFNINGETDTPTMLGYTADQLKH